MAGDIINQNILKKYIKSLIEPIVNKAVKVHTDKMWENIYQLREEVKVLTKVVEDTKK